jgi:NAD(P)-dependent dehydrogenase (short-subunit alcohol dehydrogenase family)
MKIALVTGANRGLGFETSKQLANNGFKVYMGCRDGIKGKVACELLKEEGLNVELLEIDVTKTKEIRSAVDVLKSNNEIPDVIVNNAGVFLEMLSEKVHDSILTVDPVIVLKTIETNTMGPLKLLQALVPYMKEKEDARIINISSEMGQLSEMGPRAPGYRISKTALNALTKILAAELEDTNIAVNSVCPGWVRTQMGGDNATSSISEGVETTIWLATTKNPPSGKFFRDQKEISW